MFQSEKLSQYEHLVVKPGVRINEDKANDSQGIDETSNVAKPVKKVVSLPIRDNKVEIEVDLHTGKLVTTFWIFIQVIGPRAILKWLFDDVVVVLDRSLAILDQLRLVL